jgi:hypothetical protein
MSEDDVRYTREKTARHTIVYFQGVPRRYSFFSTVRRHSRENGDLVSLIRLNLPLIIHNTQPTIY